MKRYLLLACAVAFVSASRAQCIPNLLYQDSVFGVWPDTIEGFNNGTVNQFYSDTMNLLIPVNAQDIDPNFPNFVIDSVQFDGVTGLPPGLSVGCTSQTPAPCTYIPQQVGCGLIEGIPTTAGTYPLDLNVIAFFTFFGNPVPYPYSFSGYAITILPATGISEIGPALTGVQNTPNPFTGRTNIEIGLARPAQVTLRVFNLIGAEIHTERFDGRPGMNRVAFDGSTLDDGIYLYEVEAGAENFTGRMVLHR